MYLNRPRHRKRNHSEIKQGWVVCDAVLYSVALETKICLQSAVHCNIHKLKRLTFSEQGGVLQLHASTESPRCAPVVKNVNRTLAVNVCIEHKPKSYNGGGSMITLLAACFLINCCQR